MPVAGHAADEASRDSTAGAPSASPRRSGPLRTILRITLWTLLAAVLVLAFRGYLSPTFLLDFANSWLC
jgi:hypothetical protein